MFKIKIKMGNYCKTPRKPLVTYVVQLKQLQKLAEGKFIWPIENMVPAASNCVYTKYNNYYLFETCKNKFHQSETPLWIHLKIVGITDECKLAFTDEQYELLKTYIFK